MSRENALRVVIVGGGFGGLYAAKSLGDAGVDVTLIDKRNFHLFQPLLYQVATGGLSPGDISSPLRAVLRKHPGTTVLQAEVTGIDADGRRVMSTGKPVPYDVLVIATGAGNHYFGNDEWARHAPALKTIEDALDIRSRVFGAFELAERTDDDDERGACLTFVVVGAGPTGVELAGALGELARSTLKGNFRRFDPADARIFLVEGEDRVLPPYPAELSEKAARSLAGKGVTIRTGTLVSDVDDAGVALKDKAGREERIDARTVLWAAGVAASPLAQSLAEQSDAELDRAGRVIVEPDLSLAGRPEIFVIGDLACFTHHDDEDPLPGVAPVAMQQGEFVARLIVSRRDGRAVAERFRYRDKGSLAVIGRNAAVADLPRARLSGLPAWLIWVFVHIRYLIEYDNKIIVMTQWAMNYITRKRGARLITYQKDRENE